MPYFWNMPRDIVKIAKRNEDIYKRFDKLHKSRLPVKMTNGVKMPVALDYGTICEILAEEFYLSVRSIEEILKKRP